MARTSCSSTSATPAASAGRCRTVGRGPDKSLPLARVSVAVPVLCHAVEHVAERLVEQQLVPFDPSAWYSTVVPLMRVLPVVKAYPVIDPVSRSEAVCVAGFSMEHPFQWVRLFPLDFRGLLQAQKFKKYEVIELVANKSKADSRPESYTPVLDSIARGDLIDTDNGTWRRRLPYFDANEDESMCEIQRRQKRERKSLGVFRPSEVSELEVKPAEEGFAASQRALLNQPSLTGDRAGDEGRVALEPLPVKARFHYRCADPKCPGHVQSLIDWELGALYRRLQGDLGDDEAAIHDRIRAKFLDQYCGDPVDTRFITGSMLRHPTAFLILGLVHPKRRDGPQAEALF